MEVTYKKHFNLDKNRTEFSLINWDYENGNDYLAKIFCKEFGMSADEKVDGIYFSIIKLSLCNIIYELLWHEDTGNALYSVEQNREVIDILEQRLNVVLNKLNQKLEANEFAEKERVRYILVSFEGEKFYMELDAQGYAIRQLIVDKYSTIHLSCREDCLAEGNVFDMDIEGEVQNISRKLFEEKWSLAILPYEVEWIQTKKKYLIGSRVRGKSLFFYPQGIVMKGQDFFAIYNDNKIKQIDQDIEAQVIAYDEENMWLILT